MSEAGRAIPSDARWHGRGEPVTMATDFLLAAVAGTLSVLLIVQAADLAAVAWAAAFASTAAAAILGGVFHGYRTRLGEARARVTWRATLLLSATAACLLLVAGASGVDDRLLRRVLLAVALLKLALASVRLWRTGRFAAVVQDAAASLALVLLVAGGRIAGGDGGGAGWIAAGALTAIAAGLVQRRERRYGAWLNHNDVFHFMQAVACYLFYRGALLS